MQGPLDLLVELRPAYFAAGPSIMHALADLTERRGIRVNFESPLGYGEAVGEAERDVARRSFEARIVELYSSKEAGAIAHQCFEGSGLHVNAETMLVEIVGDNGDLTAVGETGRVVVTPFSSSAQPLIRYDQGDRAVAGARCPCGRTLPVLDSIVGRSTADFIHPNGRSSARLPFELRKLLGAGQWQIAQVGPNNYEVRFTRRDWGQPREEALFVQKFREWYFADAEVRLVPVTEIPLTSAGKFIEYINEWSAGRVRP
jgi:phenylacetate-CoA ligase